MPRICDSGLSGSSRRLFAEWPAFDPAGEAAAGDAVAGGATGRRATSRAADAMDRWC